MSLRIRREGCQGTTLHYSERGRCALEQPEAMARKENLHHVSPELDLRVQVTLDPGAEPFPITISNLKERLLAMPIVRIKHGLPGPNDTVIPVERDYLVFETSDRGFTARRCDENGERIKRLNAHWPFRWDQPITIHIY